MIERKFVAQRTKEFLVQEYIGENLKRVGHSHTKMIKTPLGVKVIIYASRPGLIVGKKGQNIKKLTNDIKKKFNLENPQIEINEIENIGLDAQIIAETIANSLERYGAARFKGIGHKTMTNVLESGALGVEILLSGKIPSSRAKRWRFYQGYLKKSGDISQEGIKKAVTIAQLKSGTIGIQVKIMPPDIQLPDEVKLIREEDEIKESNKAEKEKDTELKDEAKEKKTKESAVKKTKAKEKPEKEIKKHKEQKKDKAENKSDKKKNANTKK
tara:strand:+ start:4210 stop:5019 length:810 start_codon:yes stop_codon:yes gene_type:complete